MPRWAFLVGTAFARDILPPMPLELQGIIIAA